jgi:hypothetical protein
MMTDEYGSKSYVFKMDDVLHQAECPRRDQTPCSATAQVPDEKQPRNHVSNLIQDIAMLTTRNSVFCRALTNG